MPHTLILLSALGPLREALYRAQTGVKQGHKVLFICFRQDVADFLDPLRSDNIEVHLHSETLTFDIRKLPIEMAAIRRFQAKLQNLYGHIQKAEVWAYSSSISLSSILALHFFARRYPVNYNGTYEGRYAKDGIFYQPTAKNWRRIKAKCLGLFTGAEIEFVRDWSPVPVLSDAYIKKQTRTVTNWELTTPRCELECPLLRRCDKGILLLFTNYSDYFRADKQDKLAFDEFCDRLGNLLLHVSGESGIAVKPHPSCSKLPINWKWMDHINPAFPLEFLDLSPVRIILGDASTSMISPLHLDHKTVLSYAYLLNTSWAHEVTNYLEQRVDPEKKILRPQSWEELKILIEREIRS